MRRREILGSEVVWRTLTLAKSLAGSQLCDTVLANGSVPR